MLVAGLKRLSHSVSIEEALPYSAFVKQHEAIAYWRERLGRREADASTLETPQTAIDLINLRKNERKAVAEARSLGLGVCGHIASQDQ
jgi:predicted nucleic acid-binding protein